MLDAEDESGCGQTALVEFTGNGDRSIPRTRILPPFFLIVCNVLMSFYHRKLPMDRMWEGILL